MTIAELPSAAPLAVRRRAAPLHLFSAPWIFGGLAVLLGLVYGFGFLRQLSYHRFPDIVPTEQPLATALGTDRDGALHFTVPVLLAFLIYGAAVLVARKLGGRRLILVAVIAGVSYVGIFLPTNPLGAQDIYHNVFDARILWRYHDNPNVVPPAAFPDDPLFPSVVAWNEFASVYGPVWYAVSGLPYVAGGDDLRDNIIGHKVLTATFMLGTAVLAYALAERLRKGSGLAAFVAVAWNPLMLFETAGNAHNDIVMVFFAVAALYSITTRRWWLAFPLLALSVATKYGMVILGPPMLIWLLRQPHVPRRAIAASLLAGIALAAAIYVPFFAGRDTLDAIQRQAAYSTSSPSELLSALLRTHMEMTPEDALTLMKRIVVPLFLLAYIWQVARVRADAESLIERCLLAVFLLMLIATWWFWPWYVMWIVPLAAVATNPRIATLGLVFSCSAMLMYVPYFWLLYGDGLELQEATSAVAFLPPLLVVVVWSLARWLWPRGKRSPEPLPFSQADAA